MIFINTGYCANAAMSGGKTTGLTCDTGISISQRLKLQKGVIMRHIATMILVPLLWLNATTTDSAETQKISGSPTHATPQKEDAMIVDDLTTTADSTIPPIDRAAPDNFETAAFGLG